MTEPIELVRVRLITFNQDEDGEEVTVKFEIMDGREDGYTLSMEQEVQYPASSEDFDRIIQDAAKTLHRRLSIAADSLSQQYGL